MSFIIALKSWSRILLLTTAFTSVSQLLRKPGSGDTLNNNDQDCEIELKQKRADLVFLQGFLPLHSHTALFYRNQLYLFHAQIT